MKKNIGIFFGSDTGNTEKISYIIQKIIGNNLSDVLNISKCKKNDLEKYDFLILGTPTWYYGELQYDWLEFIPILKKINFLNKKISLFGCGDQEDYAEYFCDAMYYIWKIIINNNGKINGYWPVNNDYKFKSSKSIINNKYFIGLALDEDRQSNKTEKRIKKWIKSINL